MNPNSQEIDIQVGRNHLKAILVVPEDARAMVIFSHGSGSSRFSPRNNYVAGQLNQKGIATLMVDLLTPEEDSVYENRFDITLLTERLIAVTNEIHREEQFKSFPIGYFGASTGAASALNAAVQLDELISAVVSRGGRPDLADIDFTLLKAPILFIVGGLDTAVLEMNADVYNQLRCEKKLVIVDGATHLFEEEGKLEEVAQLASDWFQKFLISTNTNKPLNANHDF